MQQQRNMEAGKLTIESGNEATTRGVQTGPGAMAFTLIPREMRWDDKPFVKVTMAPCSTSDMTRPVSCVSPLKVRAFVQVTSAGITWSI